MDKLDTYIKALHDRVGDYLFDPEPSHEPLLESMRKQQVEEFYAVLSNFREQSVINELKEEKQEWVDNPVEGGRIG